MIFDIRKLTKQHEILNSEGTILGLYNIAAQIYLGSYLKDGSGMVYYATTTDLLRKYFNSEIELRHLYSESEDFIVTRKFRNETDSFLKNDLTDLIQCGDKLYLEIPDSMKNLDFEKTFYGS